MRRAILCANWKMNLPSTDFAAFFAAAGRSGKVEVVVAPPFPFLGEVAPLARNAGARVAAQNVSEHVAGAFTGEVSAAMLRRAGADQVIVGHSERRSLYGETDAVIGRKLARAFAEQLEPIFCIGEDQQTRDSGGTLALLERQLRGALAELDAPPRRLVVAYEPVWAIGTGKNATPEIAAETHRGIRALLGAVVPGCDARVLYGGSVTDANAAALAAEDEIDGFLVGGASLDGSRFGRILEALETASSRRG